MVRVQLTSILCWVRLPCWLSTVD